MELHNFVARRVSAQKFDAIARAIQFVGQQPEQGFVRGGVHRRRGDFDAEFVAQRLADFVGRGARLQFHREQKTIGSRRQKRLQSRVIHV